MKELVLGYSGSAKINLTNYIKLSNHKIIAYNNEQNQFTHSASSEIRLNETGTFKRFHD